MTSPIVRLRSFVLDSPWRLWTRQALAVMRMELKRSVISRRGAWIYLLALLPVVGIGAHAIDALQHSHGGGRYQHSLTDDTQVLAGIFQFYYLRMAIFFGSMGIFTWLFRGEYVEKIPMEPLRREVLTIGKFLAG